MPAPTLRRRAPSTAAHSLGATAADHPLANQRRESARVTLRTTARQRSRLVQLPVIIALPLRSPSRCVSSASNPSLLLPRQTEAACACHRTPRRKRQQHHLRLYSTDRHPAPPSAVGNNSNTTTPVDYRASSLIPICPAKRNSRARAIACPQALASIDIRYMIVWRTADP